jgi:hypothetical protein
MSDTCQFAENFRKLIIDLDADVQSFVNSDPTLEEVCIALVALNHAKVELGIVYDSLVGKVSQIMDQNPEVVLPDGSSIEKKWANDRKGWRHKELAQEVSTRLSQMAVDMDTGEVLYSQQELISMLLDYVQPSYWRIKELQKIGLNADNYCEVGETKASIIVRKAKS